MKKMIISLIIEGSEEDIKTIKGNIITTASEALVSCKADILKEKPKELKVPNFVTNKCSREQIKKCINILYGYCDTDIQSKYIEELDKKDPYEIGII